MNFPKYLFFFLFLSFCFNTSCSSLKKYSPIEIEKESKRIHIFFEKSFNAFLNRNPESLTAVGRKEKYDQLNDYSEEFIKEELKIVKKELKVLRGFNYQALNKSSKISYLIFRKIREDFIFDFNYRFYNYTLSSFYGFHTFLPSFMISKHSISNLKEAKAYIGRLKDFRRVFNQIMVRLKIQEKKRIYPPAFVFQKIIHSSKNIISGKPFTTSFANAENLDFNLLNPKRDSRLKKGKDSIYNSQKSQFITEVKKNKNQENLSPLYKDFLNKINSVNTLTQKEKKELLTELTHALIHFVYPAYRDLIHYVERLSKNIKGVKGVWVFGDFIYKFYLKRSTTTYLTPEEIHQMGLKQTQRIHQEIKAIQKKLHFKGNLKDFFKFLKSSQRFYYPNTEKGRKTYLMKTKNILDEMKTFMPKLFHTFPKTPLVVLPVEKFREKVSGIAYYDGPSENGIRPGKYYINLSDMKKLPKYEMQALAYHEGIPGHHYQIALAMENKEIPSFRRYQKFTAFTEGWALYAEQIPNELRLYKDNESRLGRLIFELWRATRLVVDSGIHKYRWTKEQAIKYLKENTPFQEANIKTSVERYFLWPGQATAYMVGMLKILELKNKAKEELKEQFDLRAFHYEILRHGDLPLDLLEKLIHQWIRDLKDKSEKKKERE